MRIALDARPLAGPRTGIGRYMEGILLGLLPRLELEEFALCSPRDLVLSEMLRRDNRVRAIVQKGWKGNLWLQIALPRLLQTRKVDLFHGTLFLLPILSSCPQVLNVYDLTLYRYPGSMEWKNLCLLRLLLPASLRKAKKIVTLSEFVRREIGAMWPALAEKVVVIPGAPYLERTCREKLPGPDRKRVLRRYGLLDPYILFVGTLEPRKNIEKMLDAYFLLEKMGVTGRQMVLVGPSGWGLGPIQRALENSSRAACIRWLGYVPDEDLAVLYQEAELFLYLSVYEGFGFPPLEAMAAGTCVVASDRASLAECLGDAAVLVDPLNVEEVAEAIRSLLADEDYRREVAEKGRIHAGRFSWEKSAEKTAQVYNGLALR